jgi:hypothetical protein
MWEFQSWKHGPQFLRYVKYINLRFIHTVQNLVKLRWKVNVSIIVTELT